MRTTTWLPARTVEGFVKRNLMVKNAASYDTQVARNIMMVSWT